MVALNPNSGINISVKIFTIAHKIKLFQHKLYLAYVKTDIISLIQFALNAQMDQLTDLVFVKVFQFGTAVFVAIVYKICYGTLNYRFVIAKMACSME